MHINYSEDFWLHEHYEISLPELAQLAGLTEAELCEWVEEGLLAPIDPKAVPWTFSADRLVTVQKACRLRRDFQLEPQVLALVVQLIDRIENLETEVRDLRAKLPRVLR